MNLLMNDLIEIADRHGLVTRHDLEGSGRSRGVWSRAVRRGELNPVADGVGLLAGRPVTPTIRIAAAVRSASGCLASHRSAAFLLDVWRTGDRPVEVIRRRGRDITAIGTHVMTHRPVDRADVVDVPVHGIACTSPARTVVDFAAVRPRHVFDLIVNLRATQQLTLHDLEMEVAARGRTAPGMAATRQALDRQLLQTTPPDSVLEARFAELCHGSGLPSMEHHAIVLGYEVDFLVIGHKVIIECDGFAYHGRDARAFERDRRRDADLVAAGYVVIRVTWGMVCDRPDTVIRTIRAALRSPH
jgi:very-short-patch-repair endonuclease